MTLYQIGANKRVDRGDYFVRGYLHSVGSRQAGFPLLSPDNSFNLSNYLATYLKIAPNFVLDALLRHDFPKKHNYAHKEQKEAQMDRNRARRAMYAVIFFVVIGVLMCIADKAHSEIMAPANLYKGIIGEAVGEGYDGMYAVACVYRNRLEKGLPLGCVALKRKDLDAFVKRQGARYEVIAKKIVQEVFAASISKPTDPTHGATHYENLSAFGTPRWALGMVITAKVGSHTFFKEK